MRITDSIDCKGQITSKGEIVNQPDDSLGHVPFIPGQLFGQDRQFRVSAIDSLTQLEWMVSVYQE